MEKCRSQITVMRRFLQGLRAVSADGRVSCLRGMIYAKLEPIGRTECGVVILPKVPEPWTAARVRVLDRLARAAGKEVQYESYSSRSGAN